MLLLRHKSLFIFCVSRMYQLVCAVYVQYCFTSTETGSPETGSPETATSTFTQLLSSVCAGAPVCYYVLRIVFLDTFLRQRNTLIITVIYTLRSELF